jgi:predicted Zn-dependent protease
LIAADRGIGAWSWPDGTVVLTWGLMDSLDDGALVAALAHEVGHNELGIRPGPASLAGGRGLVIERAADRAGAALLAARGLDPATMPRMLRLVAARVGEQTKAGRAALSRAGNLEAELSAGRLGQARGTRPRSSR